MNKLPITLSIIVTTLLLTACGEGDSTPEAITQDYMELKKKWLINMNRRLVDKEDIPVDRKTEKALTEKTVAMMAPGFSSRKLERPSSLINRYLLDHHKDNYNGLNIDIGDTKIDGTRAKVLTYIGSDECHFSYSNIDGRWLLSDLSCTRYQH